MLPDDASANVSTAGSPAEVRSPGPRVVAGLLAAVLAFRLGAWASPSSYVEIQLAWTPAINLLGVLFALCGVWVWTRLRGSATRVFLVYCLGSGIHWGGLPGTGDVRIDTAWLALYVAASTIGDIALLDLALRVPTRVGPEGKRRAWLYAPAAVAILAIPAAPFLPRSLAASLLAALLGFAFLSSTAAGVVLLVRCLRAGLGARSGRRRRIGLLAVAAALALSSALTILAAGSALPGATEAWSLSFAVVPLSLAFALSRSAL